MVPEVCSYCGRHRPNRFCPVLGKPLCSQCCGRNRRKSITCSDDCRYLLESRRQALKRLINFSGDGSFELKMFSVLHDLRLALVKFREGQKESISDVEIVSAIGNAIETLRVRARGLIYHFHSTNPIIQQATDVLLGIAELYQNDGRANMRIAPEDIVACLRYLEKQITGVKARGGSFWDLTRETVGMRLIVKTPEKEESKILKP
ncbi:hypothetical protein HPY86_00860 [candidate division WOR-3 bacterium]|nr:hypothetical protein [candidate division WOR-3 bacterium]